MKMTPEIKRAIDQMSYEELLRKNRFTPVGDQWFQGETGEYFLKRMAELRKLPGGEAEHVRASRAIGW